MSAYFHRHTYRTHMRWLIVVGIISWLIPISASALTFGIPILCEYGEDCFIQNYADHDYSDDYHDYTCGRLSYNGHRGTDFLLRNYLMLDKGTDVVAAADGTVAGIRNTVEDVSINTTGKEAIKGKECGNGVMLRHADAYTTQYCHMKKGSVVVKAGDTVVKGQKLGQVGLSGLTESPHLEFHVRHKGRSIDPFMVVETGSDDHCGDTKSPNLWDPDVSQLLHYLPTSMLSTGFSTEEPNMDAVRHGKFSETALRRDAPMIIFWADMIGILPGDKLSITLTSPAGAILAESSETFDKSQIQFFKYIGKRARQSFWSRGVYTGSVELVRGGAAVISDRVEITVE